MRHLFKGKKLRPWVDLWGHSSDRRVSVKGRPPGPPPQDPLGLYSAGLFVFGMIRFIVMKGWGDDGYQGNKRRAQCGLVA